MAIIQLDEAYAVRVEVLEWEGRKRLDVRFCWRRGKMWQGSKNGVMIPPEKAAEFADAVNDAAEELNQIGAAAERGARSE